MDITISNSEGNQVLTSDDRFLVLDGDFGLTQRIAEEIVNPLADVDVQRSDDWGKLREIVLKVRVRGADMDDLITNADWLQEQTHLDDSWWLIVKPTPTMPNSYFRVLKSPLFPVPLTGMAQSRFKLDVEVRLNAEPFVYGAEQTLCTSQALSNPGVYQINEAYGDFETPVKMHVVSDGGEASWFGMSEFDFAPLVITSPGNKPHSNFYVVSGNIRGNSAYNDTHFPPWGYARFEPSTFPRTGTYRVLVRIKDMHSTARRFKLWVSDWEHSSPNARGVRPSTYREYRIQGTSRLDTWVWVDVGEFRSGGGRDCCLWAGIWRNHIIDKVVFLPTDMGMLGLYQYNHVFNKDRNERPSDMSWDEFTYERPSIAIDNLTTAAACCGTGLMLPAGTGTQYLATVMNPDNKTPTVTLTYRPRYAGWARE